MAGGHASSRVDSGSMKFRPGVAARRPNPSSPSSRPTPSNASVRSTSSQKNSANIPSSSRSRNATSGSETEASTSVREKAPAAIPPCAAVAVSITPGISRAVPARPNPVQINPRGPLATPAPSQPTPHRPARNVAFGAGLPSSTHPASSASGSVVGSSEILEQPNMTFAVPTNQTLSTPASYPNLRLPPTSGGMSFPTPPATQALPADFQPSQPGSSGTRISAPIQIGLTRLNASSRLPTPPLTQMLAGFPLDPTLFGDEDESVDLPAPPSTPDVGNTNDVAPGQANPLFGDMPPPPELPTAPGPSSSNLDGGVPEELDAGPSSAAPKVRRSRRVAGIEAKPRKKRKVQTPDDADRALGESEADEAERPKRRRMSRKAKERKAVTVEEKISAFEKKVAEAMEEGGEGEPLDPTSATMASLCEPDLPSGRLSSKFLEKGIAYVKHVEDRRKRILERTAERLQKLRTSGLDPDDPRQPPPAPAKQPSPTPGAEVDEAGNPIAGPSTAPERRELGASLSPSPEPERAPGETFAESAAAPQIRFVNGEMVLDEDSQFYDRAGPAGAQDEDAMVVVDEADSTRFSNSASFARKAGARGTRWTADETEMFYWCLSAFGEDYENIARYLGRTPQQCKNKTKTEDKRGNEKRITEAIKTRIPLDLEEFGRITGRDFSGPPPEIRAPVLPLAENKEQETGGEEAKAKAAASTSGPTPTSRKKGKGVAHAEEEIMTLEEYERDGKED